MALTRVGGAVKSDRIFDTVADMVASKTVKVGDIVETAGYTTVNDGGDAKYRVVAGGTGTADGGRYIDISNGNQSELIMTNSPALLYQLGGKWDNSTDDSAKVQIIVDNFDTFYVPDGAGYVQTFPDISAKNSFSIVGSNSIKSIIRTNMASGSYITPFNQGLKISGVEIKNATSGGTIVKTGIGIDGDDAGAFFHNFYDVILTGFDNQANFRRTVWSSFESIICQDYGTSPIDFLETNKAGGTPAGGWNVGYWGNMNRIGQYVCRRGGRGPRFVGMCCTIDTLTLQELTDATTMASFEQVSSGDRSFSANFLITSLYCEINEGALIFKNQDVTITNMFAQGGAVGSPQALLFKLENAAVNVGICKGQNYFDKLYDISSGSELRTTQPLGAIVNLAPTEDSTSYYFDPEFVAGYHYKFDVQHSGSPAAVNYTIPITLENQTEYELTINGLENGSVIRRESYDVFRWSSDALTSADVRSTSGSIPWTITFTGNQPRVDVNIALGLDLDITIQKKLSSRPKTL